MNVKSLALVPNYVKTMMAHTNVVVFKVMSFMVEILAKQLVRIQIYFVFYIIIVYFHIHSSIYDLLNYYLLMIKPQKLLWDYKHNIL